MINLRFKWLDKGEWVKKDENTQTLILHAQRLDCIFGKIPIVKIRKGAGYVAEDEINLALIVETQQSKLKHDLFNAESDVVQIAGEPYYRGSSEGGDARQVWQFIGSDSGLPFRLGLTVHSTYGTWSSTPHKFEIDALTSPAPIDFYEEFAYMTNPKGKWGVQVKQGHMKTHHMLLLKESRFIADRSVEQIPFGSHPVTGGPGIQLAYFWVCTASDLGLIEKFG
jgi:5-deoxy-D-glucuronate isomerase